MHFLLDVLWQLDIMVIRSDDFKSVREKLLSKREPSFTNARGTQQVARDRDESPFFCMGFLF